MLLQIPGVLSAAEIASLREQLKTAPFEDGAATALGAAREVKRNLQVPVGSEASGRCGAVVMDALRRNQAFYSAVLPKQINGPLFNRYDVGMTYGDHVDNSVFPAAIPMRSDVSATLFLSDPAEYDGGELVVNDSFGAHAVKPAAGSIIAYPSGSVHRVQPVTRGSRLAAVIWVQSLVREDERRRALFELDLALGALRQKFGEAPEMTALTAVYHNLLRMWAES